MVPHRPPRIAVIGLGNVLLSDDAFGPTVIELLRASWDVPDEVELIDAGTPGLDLVDYLHDRDDIILIDAVAIDAAPGEIHVFSGDDIKSLPLKPRVSPHDPALQEALWLADIDGGGARRVVLIGAAPQSSDADIGLNPAMRDAVDEAVQMVVDRLEILGCEVKPSPRRRHSAWWLRDQPRAADVH